MTKSNLCLPKVAVFGTSTVSRIIVNVLQQEVSWSIPIQDFLSFFFLSALPQYLREFSIFQGFQIEAIWGQTPEEAEFLSRELKIPYFTSRVDDVLLRKEVDLIVILCSPALHSQIAVKALGECMLEVIMIDER